MKVKISNNKVKVINGFLNLRVKIIREEKVSSYRVAEFGNRNTKKIEVKVVIGFLNLGVEILHRRNIKLFGKE